MAESMKEWYDNVVDPKNITRYVRPGHVYGYSPVEQILNQIMQLQYFTEGNDSRRFWPVPITLAEYKIVTNSMVGMVPDKIYVLPVIGAELQEFLAWEQAQGAEPPDENGPGLIDAHDEWRDVNP